MGVYGYMTFLAKLRKLMKTRGLSNKELGPMIGTYPERISKWFAGKGLPDIYQGYRISKALKVPMEYLADDEMQEIPPESAISDDERAVIELYHALELNRREALRRLATPVPPPERRGAVGVTPYDAEPLPAAARAVELDPVSGEPVTPKRRKGAG